MRKTVSTIILAASLFSGAAPSPARAAPVTVGVVGSASALIWLYYIAQEQGFFKKHGSDVDLVSVSSSADGVRQLAGASLNILIGTGLIDSVRAAAKGSTIVIARIEGQAPPYSMLAKPSLKALGDLRGKLISVGGATDITKVYAQRMIAVAGLKKDDVDYVYAGASSPRFLSLQSGAVDAALVSPPFNLRGAALGLVNLGDVPDVVKNLPFAGDNVDSKWAGAHGKELSDFLAAYQDGVDWFYDPANRQPAIDILVKYAKASPEDAQGSYAFLQKIKYFEPSGAISRRKIEEVIEALKETGESQAPSVDQVIYSGARTAD